ncbi:uncharacterized protein LOC131973016 [Centropristis striata]|uniref:uncharacterized protein LOC131973016 n=1 Tax=Centropristis striata TaxID=184440 RepID=UPI0027DED380|nr:uncharacterized protein LOC131973016 [Centropristis striata]
MRGAAMRLTAAAGGFVVFLLSMSAVQGENGWRVTYTPTQVCALKGSTVEMSCTYTYPSRINYRDTTVEKILWFTRVNHDEPVDLKTDSEYSGRVQYSSNNNDCTLTIRDLRESDSAEYFFGFITNQPDGKFIGPPGVNLSITDPHLHIEVIKSIVHQSYAKAELRCRSRCRLPDSSSYIWYKNGQKVQGETSSFSVSASADSFSCALKGHEDSPSPAVCVDGHYCHRVIYTDRRICSFKGSSVDISCTYNSYDRPTSKFWFSPRQYPSQPEDLRKDSKYAGRIKILETNIGRSTLRISDLRESDSAEYHFRFKTGTFEWRSSLPGTTLTVTDPDLQMQVKLSWFYPWAELKCHSSCRLPDSSSYIWYKNGQKTWGEKSSYSGVFHPKDSYACAVKGYKDFPSPSVCIHGQTCNRVIYTDRSICASKGSSVDISCTYSSYEDHVESEFWFSHERSPSEPEDLLKDHQYAGRVQVLETERGRSTLRISDLRDSAAAEYHFKFKTPSFEWRSSLPGTTLTVTGTDEHKQIFTATQLNKSML